MGVPSAGNSYGVPSGLIYSFPVVCRGGVYRIVEGVPVDDFLRRKMDLTTKELLEERQQALGA
jgi:malate dehydrogenase